MNSIDVGGEVSRQLPKRLLLKSPQRDQHTVHGLLRAYEVEGAVCRAGGKRGVFEELMRRLAPQCLL